MAMEKKQPLTDKDMLGLVSVKVKGSPIKCGDKGEILIFRVEYEGKEYRIGVIGNEAYESVKSHGFKGPDGTIWLEIPKSILKSEGVGWINQPY